MLCTEGPLTRLGIGFYWQRPAGACFWSWWRTEPGARVEGWQLTVWRFAVLVGWKADAPKKTESPGLWLAA